MNQRPDRVGQQLVEELAVSRAEVTEQMMIDPDAATDPHVRQIPLAQPVELPGTADPLDRREHPQRHQNLGIDRIPPGRPLDRLNLRRQRVQVERINIPPHHPRPNTTRERSSAANN